MAWLDQGIKYQKPHERTNSLGMYAERKPSRLQLQPGYSFSQQGKGAPLLPFLQEDGHIIQ